MAALGWGVGDRLLFQFRHQSTAAGTCQSDAGQLGRGGDDFAFEASPAVHVCSCCRASCIQWEDI